MEARRGGGATLGLLAGAGVTGKRYLEHEHQLDVQAERAVGIDVVSGEAPGDGSGYGFVLTNFGARRVHLLGFRLLGTAFEEQHLDDDLDPASAMTITVRPGTRCDATQEADPPSKALVRLRTDRGTVMTYSAVMAEPNFAAAYEERVRCGFQPPSEATQLLVEQARVHGRAMSLVLTGSNASRWPITLDGFTVAPGLAVTAKVPGAIPGSDPSTHVWSATPIRLTVRVTSCRRLRESWAFTDPTSQLLLARVHNRYESGTVELLTGDGGPGLELSDDQLLRPLLDSCP